ncbi:MAG: histidinol dehydrogenase [Geminicoccaceae bacterium]|nr:histidinol dehydrogenase [Geminicoccaceae bacterium]
MQPSDTDDVRIIDLTQLSGEQRAALQRRAEADLEPFLERVRPIVGAVRDEGDAALLRLARELEGATVERLRASPDDVERAEARLPAEIGEAIDFASASIRRFHEVQKPETMWLKEVRPGAFAGDRYRPIRSVACYVPRGKGAFPSVTMMTTIPAVVAGVPRVVVVTPPGPDGRIDDATLVAARRAGVEEVYACGGAQAIAAVAFGTETIPRTIKVVGPGSPYVIAAKRLLSDRIDTGLPAGPSEALILADDSADGRIAALDLIIESEHGPDSSAFLVTPSREVAEAAAAMLPELWARLGAERARFSKTVLGGPRGGILVARDMEDAIRFVNEYAPEHLEVLSHDPFGWLGEIEEAGEILLGTHTPIVLGNFVLGPDCVLPTGGWARTYSPLSVFDFMKRSSLGHVTAKAYPKLARHARTLAEYEGFDGHALAVSELRDELMRG